MWRQGRRATAGAATGDGARGWQSWCGGQRHMMDGRDGTLTFVYREGDESDAKLACVRKLRPWPKAADHDHGPRPIALSPLSAHGASPGVLSLRTTALKATTTASKSEGSFSGRLAAWSPMGCPGIQSTSRRAHGRGLRRTGADGSTGPSSHPGCGGPIARTRARVRSANTSARWAQFRAAC